MPPLNRKNLSCDVDVSLGLSFASQANQLFLSQFEHRLYASPGPLCLHKVLLFHDIKAIFKIVSKALCDKIYLQMIQPATICFSDSELVAAVCPAGAAVTLRRLLDLRNLYPNTVLCQWVITLSERVELLTTQK